MPTPANLIWEKTTGTASPFTLSTVARSFNDAFGTGGTDKFYFFMYNRDVAGEWMVASGHLSASTTLVVDTVIEGSNGTSAVAWSAGTKDISNDIPAAKQLYTGLSNTLDNIDLIVAELAMMAADALNVAQFLGATGNRFADSFDALTYVNTGGATNLDTGTAGLLKPTVVTGSNQVPSMTSNTAPSGTAAASSIFSAGTDAYKAFDRASSLGWLTASGNTTGWLSYAFTSAKTISSYTITAWTSSWASGTAGRAPKNFTLQYDSGGGTWVTLDTQTNQTAWADGEKRTFTVASPVSATSYRINITLNNGDVSLVGIEEAELIITGSTNNLTVTSTSLTAAATPTSAKLTARVNEVDSITLNTDLIFSVSRDGGTTYTAFTMTDKFTAGGAHVLDSNSLDISAQPSGTAMRWKATTANGKMVELWDVYLYWT